MIQNITFRPNGLKTGLLIYDIISIRRNQPQILLIGLSSTSLPNMGLHSVQNIQITIGLSFEWSITHVTFKEINTVKLQSIEVAMFTRINNPKCEWNVHFVLFWLENIALTTGIWMKMTKKTLYRFSQLYSNNHVLEKSEFGFSRFDCIIIKREYVCLLCNDGSFETAFLFFAVIWKFAYNREPFLPEGEESPGSGHLITDLPVVTLIRQIFSQGRKQSFESLNQS